MNTDEYDDLPAASRYGDTNREPFYYAEEEPKIFDYEAEVDILGWKFTMKTNGEFWIRTSDYVPALNEKGETCAEAHFGPSIVELLQALIDLRQGGQTVTAFPPGTRGIGMPG